MQFVDRLLISIAGLVLCGGVAFASPTVTIDQANITSVPGTSMIVVPFSVTGITGQLSNADIGVNDDGFDVFGAAQDCDHIWLDTDGDGQPDSQAERRYQLQTYQWVPPCPIVRMYFMFDLSSSMTGGDDGLGQARLDLMRQRAYAVAAGVLSSLRGSCPDVDVAIGAGAFAASPVGSVKWEVPNNFSPSLSSVQSNIDHALNLIRRDGAATNLTRAVRHGSRAQTLLELLESLDQVDQSCSDCEPRKVLKILVTFSDMVQTATMLPLTAADFPAGPDWKFVSFMLSGDDLSLVPMSSRQNVALVVGRDYAVDYTTTPATVLSTGQAYTDSDLIASIDSWWQNLFSPECPVHYLLYMCTSYRAGTHTVTITVGGESASASYAAPADDMCPLYSFDTDRDCFIRNDGLVFDFDLDGTVDQYESAGGFDSYTESLALPFLSPPMEGDCAFRMHISPRDTDVSGCLDQSADCTVPVNCSVGTCKFGPECDQDLDVDGIQLVVDTCFKIHPEFTDPDHSLPLDPAEAISWYGAYGPLGPVVQQPEMPVTVHPCDQDCAGNPASDRFYCGNWIDENGDGADEQCPAPPAPDSCTADPAEPADHSLNEALQRENTLVVPDVRRGAVDGGTWASDINLLAKGPSPGEVIQLQPCCYNLDALPGPDGFFHAVKCPTPYDVNGDHTDDTIGFCYEPVPWVEMYYIPAKDAAGHSPSNDPILSRKFCLDSNGALAIEDVLGQFRDASGAAPDNTAGILVISSNYELTLQNGNRTIRSINCDGPECPQFEVQGDLATVDAAGRTYRMAKGASNGLGKRVPAVPVDELLGASDVARLFHLTGPDRSNSNIDFGIVNMTNHEVAFEVRFVHADGTPISIDEWNVAPMSTAWQANALAAGQAGYDVYAVVKVIRPAGNEKWYAWASVKENTTGDQYGVYIGPTVTFSVDHPENARLYLPAASRDVIVPDQEYDLTDSEVANVIPTPDGDDQVDAATVKYWVAGSPAEAFVRQLEPESAYRLVDLLTDLGMEDETQNKTLVIQVESAEGEIATYNYTYRLKITGGSPDSMTYGEGVGAQTYDQLVGQGATVYLPCFGGSRYDTTVYISNPTENAVTLDLEFWGKLGWRFSESDNYMGTVLAPGGTFHVAVPRDWKATTATVKVRDGSGKVLVWAEVRDQTGNDVMTIVAR